MNPDPAPLERLRAERRQRRASHAKSERETLFAIRAGGVFAILLALFYVGQPLYAGLIHGFDAPYGAYGLSLGHKNHPGRGVVGYESIPADELSPTTVLGWGIFALLGVGMLRMANIASRDARAQEEKDRLEDGE